MFYLYILNIMFNNKIEQNSLVRYKKNYGILKYTNLPEDLINIIFMYNFDLKDYSNQYNMVKAFYNKVFSKNPYWNLESECIIKAMNEFEIIISLKELEGKVNMKKIKNLENGGRAFYGGRVLKNVCYIYHPKTKQVLVVGTENLKNFIECFRDKCIKCHIDIVRRRKTKLTSYKNKNVTKILIDNKICDKCQSKSLRETTKTEKVQTAVVKDKKYFEINYIDDETPIKNENIYSQKIEGCLFEELIIIKCIICKKDISKEDYNNWKGKCHTCNKTNYYKRTKRCLKNNCYKLIDDNYVFCYHHK